MDTTDVLQAVSSKIFASITALPGRLSHAARSTSTALTAAAGASGQGVAVVNLIISLAILLMLFLLLPWRRLRWPLPMPWDIFRQVSFANLRMVSPENHPLDSEQLEVVLLDPGKFRDVKSEDATLPLQELLEWVAQHPFTGYKGGIARLVAKILWLQPNNPDLESEIQGFNDIDLIYFLQDGDEEKKTAMKKLVDEGLTIGGIPVEAQDVEYSYDTIPHVLATRDLTQNQCIIVSDAAGRVFLICAQICYQHMLQSKTAPAVASDNSTLDDRGNVVSKPRAVGRAIIQWMKGRASTVELSDATTTFYRKQKLPKMTLFQVFCKAKGNEMYMKVYTELLRLGFVEHQQYPHALWGDCYCYVNSLIARHGYRLELESDLDSAAVEKWKEAKYAEQLARTRISIFRDFRFHRMVLDETFLMPYDIADTPLTAGLKEHMAGQLEHPSREHLTRLRRLQSRTSMQLAGGSLISSTTRFEQTQPGTTFRLGGSEAADSQIRALRGAAHGRGQQKAAEIIQRILSSGGAYLEQDDLPDDQRDPLLNQNMFGKLTMTETFLHLMRVVKIAWPQFLLSFLVNLFAAVLFVLVINHMASAFWLLAAAASNAVGAWLFIRASNCAMLNVLSSMFLALLNMRADAFSTRLFSEVWSRLVGDTRSLQGVLESCSEFTIESLTAIGALFVLLISLEPSCDESIWGTLLVVVSTGTGMAALSLLAGFSLRSSSRMSRSMIGYLYSYMFSSLSNFFEIKFIPESFAATTAAYEEIQSASLEQRKKLTLIHQVVSIFLRVTEFAALTQALYRLVHKSSVDASCSRSYAIQAMSVPILLSAVRRASEALLQLFSSVGSLERLFLLSRALLRFSTPRFDGINHFATEKICMEIPHDFTVSLGSPQFGPFARIPALQNMTTGKFNVLSMTRGQGATTFAKILLRIVDAPARIKIDGEHVEQYEQETLNFAIHIVDHPPLPSSVARSCGQGQSLAEYVQLGLEDSGLGLPLDVCLHRAGIWSQVANIPHGIECTEWSSYLTKPESYRVQLARALFRASLGTLKMLVILDPLRHCNRSELADTRRQWQEALKPLLKDLVVLVIDQTSEAGFNAWN